MPWTDYARYCAPSFSPASHHYRPHDAPHNSQPWRTDAIINVSHDRHFALAPSRSCNMHLARSVPSHAAQHHDPAIVLR